MMGLVVSGSLSSLTATQLSIRCLASDPRRQAALLGQRGRHRHQHHFRAPKVP